jgi:hypothetical protein
VNSITRARAGRCLTTPILFFCQCRMSVTGRPQMDTGSDEQQIKRIRRDPFQLEPSYVSLPVYPVLLFDAIGAEGARLPRLPPRSMTLFDLDGEGGLLETFACGKCKDISSTTSSVPCRCGVLCDTCKKGSYAAHRSDENLFGCWLCDTKYPPKAGYELCPPLSAYSGRIGTLFEWVVGNCTATCHFCTRSYESIRAVHLHMPDCARQRLRLCTSTCCLQPISCDEPHQCIYDLPAAKKYAQVPLSPSDFFETSVCVVFVHFVSHIPFIL